MARLKKANSNLTPEQAEIGAKYLTVSNTGVIGCGYEMPTNKAEVLHLYDVVSNEYLSNLGEDLSDELSMWRKDVHSFEDELRKRLPWLFGEA